MRYKKNRLTIEKIVVEKIAKKYGSPTYCYSYNQIKKNVLEFKKNFKSFSPLVCFAIKSNTNVNIIKEIKKMGLGADVVSVGELIIALKAGLSPKKIVSEKQSFERLVVTKEEALEMFDHNVFKREIIRTKVPAGTSTTVYRNGPFVDLCLGPCLEN